MQFQDDKSKNNVICKLKQNNRKAGETKKGNTVLGQQNKIYGVEREKKTQIENIQRGKDVGNQE